jgi:hypothetical protein
MQPFGLLIAGFSSMPCDHHGESAVMPARRRGVNVRHDEGITTPWRKTLYLPLILLWATRVLMSC